MRRRSTWIAVCSLSGLMHGLLTWIVPAGSSGKTDSVRRDMGVELERFDVLLTERYVPQGSRPAERPAPKRTAARRRHVGAPNQLSGDLASSELSAVPELERHASSTALQISAFASPRSAAALVVAAEPASDGAHLTDGGGRPAPKLIRAKDGRLLHRAAGWNAAIAKDGSVRFAADSGSFSGLSGTFDVTDSLMRAAGQDPYAAEKAWFLDATRTLRRKLERDYEEHVNARIPMMLARRVRHVLAGATSLEEARDGVLDILCDLDPHASERLRWVDVIQRTLAESLAFPGLSVDEKECERHQP